MDRSLAMVLVLGCLTGAAVSVGCDRQQGGYDPKVDGVAPRVAYMDSDTTGMPNILKDPRTVRTAGGGSGGGTAVRVTTPTSGKAGGEPEGPILVPETAPPVPVPPDVGGWQDMPTPRAAAAAEPAAAPVAPAAAARPGMATLDAASGDLILAGGLHLPSPALGMKWKGSANPLVFSAALEGSWHHVVFTVVSKSPESNEQARLAFAKGVYDGNTKSLASLLTDLKGTEPSLEPTTPVRASFSYEASVKGAPAFGKGIIIFGTQTYFIAALASSAQEASSLCQFADSIKE